MGMVAEFGNTGLYNISESRTQNTFQYLGPVCSMKSYHNAPFGYNTVAHNMVWSHRINGTQVYFYLCDRILPVKSKAAAQFRCLVLPTLEE